MESTTCPLDHLQQSSHSAMEISTTVQPVSANKLESHQQQNNGHHHNHGHHSANGVLSRVKSLDMCRVCGDGPARMHYGVPTCFGCKGFFRRTLKRTKEYTCRYNGNCVVDRYERNSCRFCRPNCYDQR